MIAQQFSKKTFLVFLSIAFCASLFAPQAASAAVWDWIVGAITFLPSAFLNIVLQLLILIWSLVALVAGLLLDAVTSSGFISWSYTNPANNPVIAAGYSITQSFVNMGLVLALIYISFATILRLGSFQTQRTLVTLIVVALLVNFAPVICGLIVDASNIATYYFTDHVTGFSNLLNSLKGIGDSLAASFTTLEVTKQLGVVFESIVMVAFNMALSMILFTFAILFLVRYVAIWTAVILAPIAFVAYILPATRKYFNMWLNNFLQWCIIGVVGGFFLFLGESVANVMPAAPMLRTSSGYGVFDTVMPHFVTLIFLGIGLIMALTTSAFGAKEVAAGLKRGGKAAGKVAAMPMARTAWNAAKSPVAAVKSGWQSYRTERGLRFRTRPPITRREALGHAMERAGAAVRLQMTNELRPDAMAKSVSRGIWKTVKGSAMAGATAALGIKTKKKGLRKDPCPACGFGSKPGEKIGAGAAECPHCKHVF